MLLGLCLLAATALASPSLLVPRADCRTIQVQSGDSCASLASRCGISGDDYMKYNPQPNHCSTLQVGQYVCCSSGTLPDKRPKPNADGSCYTYLVKSGDYCAAIASANSITVDNITAFNTQTWGWTGCSGLQAQQNICLSTGTPPMPASITNAVCGPQVPGTVKPSDMSTLASLNPCPLKSCCDIWGQCGTTAEFCTLSRSATGNPGTAAPGANGCISNCGSGIVNNGAAPSTFRRVGYFEGWNTKERSCLTMNVTQIDNSMYDIVHFAFAGITADFHVNITGVQDQFNAFVRMTGVKKVLSFGGWAFSTSQDTSPIFRSAVTDANRKTFINNLVLFTRQYKLDGYDFDWEYPGATDIPGATPGSPDDGQKYLSFLTNLRSALPSNKSLSIAAPASYWYLRNFPIDQMAVQLDYIVFMTYDLHGQWDYGTRWGAEGCPEGSCLRSHVNITETVNSMSMITKAGVPASKILMGIASYARSFQKKDGCDGPTCHFTGPASGAQPGACTKTAGYISNAELQTIASSDSTAVLKYDQGSDSIIMTWGTDQWASYVDNHVRQGRINFYKSLNFGGWAEWAIDLNLGTSSTGEVYYGNDTAGGFFSTGGTQLSSSGGGFAYPNLDFITQHYMRRNNPPEALLFYNVPNNVAPRTELQRIASQHQAITLYDLYYPDEDRMAPFSPDHGYFAGLTDAQQRGWFRLTSEAYTLQSTRTRAYLVWDGNRRFENRDTNWTAIWASDEFPAIYDGRTSIQEIYTIHPVTGAVSNGPVWNSTFPDSYPRDWMHRLPPPPTNPYKRATDLDPTDALPLKRRFEIMNGFAENVEGTAFVQGVNTNGGGFVPGRCTFIFRQYLTDVKNGIWSFDIDLRDDDNAHQIGTLRKQTIRGLQPYYMASHLSHYLRITPGEHASDPVYFHYYLPSQDFASASAECDTGRYTGTEPLGYREGYCTFTCEVV